MRLQAKCSSQSGELQASFPSSIPATVQQMQDGEPVLVSATASSYGMPSLEGRIWR